MKHGTDFEFAQLVRASNAAIFSTDCWHRIRSWNLGAECLFGFHAEEALGAALGLFVPEAGIEDALAHQARACAGEALVADMCCHHKSGSVVEVTVSMAPIRAADGTIIGTCAVAQTPAGLFVDRALREGAERERRRIGQELHDHLCQHLLGAAFSAKALAAQMTPLSPAAADLEALARLINSAVHLTREVAAGLEGEARALVDTPAESSARVS